MPKIMAKGRYTAEGMAALHRDGAAAREGMVQDMVAAMGGTLDGMYWGFGETDVYVIGDLPDLETAAAGALAAAATGQTHMETVVLLTAAEVDRALAKAKDLTPPS